MSAGYIQGRMWTMNILINIINLTNTRTKQKTFCLAPINNKVFNDSLPKSVCACMLILRQLAILETTWFGEYSLKTSNF